MTEAALQIYEDALEAQHSRNEARRIRTCLNEDPPEILILPQYGGQFHRSGTAVRCAAAAFHSPLSRTRVAVKSIFGAMG